MSRADRMNLIREMEAARDSSLIVYIAGDRQGLETRIAFDVFPMFHGLLSELGIQERIDLFLYSTGGLTIAGHALVSLFREFCEQFNVIIPFKAYSTATLMALGANEIVMTKMGQLSPIDPSIQHPLAPIVEMPGQPVGKQVPVSVEDVNAFIDLAKKELELSEEVSMTTILEMLASSVNPLALGAVQRAREQIAFLASRLMRYHTDDEEFIKNCADILTRERFSHQYIISRAEAKDVLRLNIVDPGDELTRLVFALFDAYNDIVMLDKPYHPEVVLEGQEARAVDFNRAVIESQNSTYVFRTKREVRRVQGTPPGAPFPVTGHQERLLDEGWIEDNTL